MDLKSFREDKLKIKTQAQFAELIGVEQSSISRWEKDPDSMPFQIIQRILEKTGASYEELTGWKKPIPKPLEIKDTWNQSNTTRLALSEYISNALEQMTFSEEQKKEYLDDLYIGVCSCLIKPKVAIVGRSDTGKSTLINALLGSEKMPTSWTPTTSIAVYIKHISDRPSFIEEDAWVFTNQLDDECMWNERKLNDEGYCRSWKIAAGGVEILRSFGTRQGDNYDKEAGSAVVFLDAPILKTCDIIDLPGFGTETNSDDSITFATAQKADVIIYLSQANGFMRIEDIAYLKRNISELPVWEQRGKNELSPLSNLFIVASQAHTISNGNRVQLSEILDAGCNNLLKTLPDGYWTDREETSGYSYIDNGRGLLRSRFFTYTTDIPDICQSFNSELTKTLETLPQIINERTIQFVREYVVKRKPNLISEIQKYEGFLADKDRYESLLADIEANEITRVRENDERKDEVRALIKQLHRESLDEFSNFFASTINVDTIIGLIKAKGVKNKKEELELFCSSLSSILQGKCESILKAKSEKLSEKAEDYVNAFSESISHAYENNSIKADFDAAWKFASALSTIGVIGGLGYFLATTLPAILALTGVGVSLGSSILLVVGSFGPIGIIVDLVIVAVLVVAKLFGGSWQKSVAKKIVAAVEENEVNEKYRDGISKYWNQTESAFSQAAAKLDEDWNTYVADLKQMVNSCDVSDIQNRIATLKYLSDFFDNIPINNG